MFQNPKSWDKWKNFFTEKGYNCVVPAWPAHEGDPATLRAQPPEHLGDLTLDDVIAAIEQVVSASGGNGASMAERPVIVGHSVGGLIAQIMVQRNLVSAAAAICPVAPNMMMTFDWPFFKNVATIANPFKGDKPFEQTPESFHAAFCNTLGEEAARQAFEETATHDSRNVLRGCLGPSGHIDLDLPHAPMLFVSAKEDQIIPTELVEKNCKAYTDESSRTDRKEFTGRSHYICNEPGWEQVAEYVYQWLQKQHPAAAGTYGPGL